MKHLIAASLSVLFVAVQSITINPIEAEPGQAARNNIKRGISTSFLQDHLDGHGKAKIARQLNDLHKRQLKTNHFPKIKQYVTAHDPKTGKSIFSKAIPEDITTDSLSFNPMPMTHLWTTESFPVDFRDDGDIKVELRSREGSFPEGLVNAKGSMLRLVDFAPSNIVPPLMHRTVSLDYVVVLEGQVEMILDSGEKRMMNRGDIGVQRGTMHAWRNPSPDQWARVLFVLQASNPVVVAGKTLGEAVANIIPGLEIPF